MNAKNTKALRKQLQRCRMRPTKAAWRYIKAHEDTWRDDLSFHAVNGVTYVFTQREAAMLRRRAVNKQIVAGQAAAKSARQKELIVASVFTSLLGVPSVILILATTVAVIIGVS
jgi:hypothetical protein